VPFTIALTRNLVFTDQIWCCMSQKIMHVSISGDGVDKSVNFAEHYMNFSNTKFTCICNRNLNYFVTYFDQLLMYCIFVCRAVKSMQYILSKRVLLMKTYSHCSAGVLNFSMQLGTIQRVCTMAF